MTQQDWLNLLAPALTPVLTAIFGVLALAITVIGTGLTKRLGAYLDAKAGAEVSKQVTDAATRVQNAMANEAGNIGLEIQAGHLDVTNLVAVKARAVAGEALIVSKLPDAVALLKPLEGAIAQGIAGKILGQVGAPMATAALLGAVNSVRVELQQQAGAGAAA